MKKIWIFIGITFCITWALWGIAFYTPLVHQVTELGLAVPLTSAGMFCPLIGALLTKLIMRKEETIDLGLRPHIKGNACYYLLAWFGPCVLTIIGAAVFFLIVPGQFDPNMTFVKQSLEAAGSGQIPAEAAPLLVVVELLAAVTVAPFINIIFTFGEEAGWRGFLFPSLCERFSQRTAVIISGLVWGLWHAPIIGIGHNYGTDYWGFPVLGILVMCVFCLSLASSLSYLTVHVKSMWPAALGHGAINAVAGLGTVFCATAGGTTMLLGPSAAGLIGGLPLLIVGLWCWFKLSAEKPVSAVVDGEVSD